jgi:hypothetical protein
VAGWRGRTDQGVGTPQAVPAPDRVAADPDPLCFGRED